MPFTDPIKKKKYNKIYCKTWYKNNRKRELLRRKEYRRKLRFQAIEKLGSKCVNCGCDNRDALEFNHVIGGGYDEKFERQKQKFYLDIIHERRNDIELTCRVCNALHYLVQLKGLPNKWKITYNANGDTYNWKDREGNDVGQPITGGIPLNETQQSVIRQESRLLKECHFTAYRWLERIYPYPNIKSLLEYRKYCKNFKKNQ